MLDLEIIEEVKKLTPEKREDLLWRLTQTRFGEVFGEDKMARIYERVAREVAEEQQNMFIAKTILALIFVIPGVFLLRKYDKDKKK